MAVALLQHTQHVEQAVAVLAARHAHHHLVTVFDKAEVSDGLRDLAHQALFELERGVGGGFFGSLSSRGVGQGGSNGHGKQAWGWQRVLAGF
ncbi:hypothetical protein D3C71_1657050 [compost metagenome]